MTLTSLDTPIWTSCIYSAHSTLLQCNTCNFPMPQSWMLWDKIIVIAATASSRAVVTLVYITCLRTWTIATLVLVVPRGLCCICPRPPLAILYMCKTSKKKQKNTHIRIEYIYTCTSRTTSWSSASARVFTSCLLMTLDQSVV